MFGNRKLGGMVGLGLGALYAWRNRSRLSGLTSKLGRHGKIGSEYESSDRSDFSSSGSSSIDNTNIGSENRRSGAV